MDSVLIGTYDTEGNRVVRAGRGLNVRYFCDVFRKIEKITVLCILQAFNGRSQLGDPVNEQMKALGV